MSRLATNALNTMLDQSSSSLISLKIASEKSIDPAHEAQISPYEAKDSFKYTVSHNSCGSFDRSDRKNFTLYFVRHGEALHNQLEKQAQKEARDAAVAEGLDSDEVEVRAEAARKAILADATISDPPLSDVGKEEAQAAKLAIDQLLKRLDLPPPEEVLVSPLQRALQTAAIIFDQNEHDSVPIRVRKEIEERRTGLPCDTHSKSEVLRQRRTFHRFSFARLQALSLENVAKAATIEEEMKTINEQQEKDKMESDSFRGHNNPFDDDIQLHTVIGRHSDGAEEESGAEGGVSSWERHVSVDNVTIAKEASIPVEDKHMLRERTKQLFDLLMESEHRSIAVVAHKGYFRELERGPLGHADAEIFKNCEVRVYRIHLDSNVESGIDLSSNACAERLGSTVEASGQ